jgi:DNA-binding phage protein
MLLGRKDVQRRLAEIAAEQGLEITEERERRRPRALSNQGNPDLETLTRVLNELGLRLAAESA